MLFGVGFELTHNQDKPGHDYDLHEAKIVWRTNDKLESMMVQSAIIQNLPYYDMSLTTKTSILYNYSTMHYF